MRPAFPSLLFVAIAASLAACAAPGPYPSLEPRPIEKALAETEEEPAEAPLPDEAGLPARIAALTAEVRRGQREFNSALPAARAAAERAGAPESESWIEAQQTLSRLEAAGAVSGKALSDLDALAIGRGAGAAAERGRSGAAQGGDRDGADIGRRAGRGDRADQGAAWGLGPRGSQRFAVHFGEGDVVGDA